MTLPEPSSEAARPRRRGALRANRLLLGFSRHWLPILALLVGLYAALPFITPVMMKLGLTGPARILYTVYAPFCHQFAFRSFFLFGDQATYPRAQAGMDVTPYEVYAVQEPEFIALYNSYYSRWHNGELPPNPPTAAELALGFTPWMQFASKDFFGSETMGYKTTLCERDVSIYGSIFLGMLIYALPIVRRRLRPVPLTLYFVLGVLPIAIDGLSQLLSYPPFNLWPPRETLPGFRVATGFLFGFMNAWLALPYLDSSMRDLRIRLEEKLRRAGVDPR